jgi:Flp pilus assembly protein TadB
MSPELEKYLPWAIAVLWGICVAAGLWWAYGATTVWLRRQAALRQVKRFGRDVISPNYEASTTIDSIGTWVASRSEKTALGQQMQNTLSKAEVGLQFDRLIGLSLVAAVVIFVVALLYSGSILFAFVGLLLTPLFIYAYIRIRSQQRGSRFINQLPDALQTMSSSLSAVGSIPRALERVVEEARAPLRDEFKFVLDQYQLGGSLRDALDLLYQRMPSEEVREFIVAVQISDRYGGDLSNLLRETAENLRQEASLRNELNSITAQASLSSIVVALLPVGVFIFLLLANPQYIAPLFSGPLGYAVLGFAFLLWAGGFFMARRMGIVRM